MHCELQLQRPMITDVRDYVIFFYAESIMLFSAICLILLKLNDAKLNFFKEYVPKSTRVFKLYYSLQKHPKITRAVELNYFMGAYLNQQE